MRFLQLLKVGALALLGAAFLVNSDSPAYSFQCDAPTHEDYAPLMALYNSTDGPNWNNNDGWGVDCDVCGWRGITCVNDRVVEIKHVSNRLDGFLPPELVGLSKLEVLDLPGNKLSGEIPANYRELDSLKRVNLIANKLSGSLVPLLNHSQKLEELIVAVNLFSGTFPTELIDLAPQLKIINLGRNKFYGEIPEEISEFYQLEGLLLFTNKFIGDLPSTLYDMHSLRTLILLDNKVTGMIDSRIGELINLKHLDLESTSMTGVLPEEIQNLSNLEHITLRATNFQGPIPDGFYSLNKLNYVDLSITNLDGPLSAGFGNLTNLKDLHLNNLNLGSIPSALGNLVNLERWEMKNSELTGQLPSSLSNLSKIRTIRFSNNNLSGPYPVFISSFSALRILNLSGNKFTGCFPDEYQNLCDQLSSSSNLGGNCTFENPRFSKFCAGDECNNSLNLSSQSMEICEGEKLVIESPNGYANYAWSNSDNNSYVFETVADESKFHYVTITSFQGCTKSDSIYIEVIPNAPGEEIAEICPGKSVILNEEEFNETGEFTQRIPRPGFCDSIINIIILEKSSDQTTLIETICQGQSFQVGNESFGSTGEYTIPLSNQEGCDSIVDLNLTVVSGEDEVLNITICEGQSYPFAGVSYNENITIQDSVEIAACKSLTTFNLTVLQPVTYEFNKTVCEGEIEPFFGNFITQAGTYEQTIKSSQNCDSTIIMHLDFAPLIEVTIDTFLCEGTSLFFEGQFYDQTGTVEISGNSKFGCDSTTFLEIEPYDKDLDYFQEVVCDGDSTFFEGDFYSAGQHQGNYFDGNCTVNFELTVAELSRIPVNEMLTFCSGSSVEFMNTSYDEGGQYYLGQDFNQCETLENLFVLEGSNSERTVPQIFCVGTPIEINGVAVTESGNYSLPSNADCANEFLNILFVSGDDLQIEHHLQEGENYEVGNETFDQTGIYEILVGDQYGCPTLIVLDLKVQTCAGLREEASTICAGESIKFFDNEIMVSGIYEHEKPLEIGCDSIIRLVLNVVEEVDFEIFGPRFICEGEEIRLSGPDGYEFLWSSGEESKDILITEGGNYELTIFDENNCASIETIEVEEVSFPQGALSIIVQDPLLCDASDGGILIDIENSEYYLYSIDGGLSFQASNEFMGLNNGTYEIALSDLGERCVKVLSSSVALESSGVPQIANIDIEEINDCLDQQGSITIIPEDESGVYLFSIDNGETWSISPNFENLEEGSYTVLMKVENSECVNNLSPNIDLENIGKLSAEVNIASAVSCTNASDGIAMVEIQEGQAPFVFQWSDGQTGKEANSLVTGTYQVTITDANGCVKALELNLDAPDIAAALDVFEDAVICEGESLIYDINQNFNYVIFKDDLIYYTGNVPEISETGMYNVVAENGGQCIAEKEIEVKNVDLSDFGIDFLLSTEGVRGVQVVMVNISDPMPDNFEWQISGENADIVSIDRFAQGVTFTDTGSYEVSLLAEVDGCLASYDKTIIIYPDSSYLGTYEAPRTPIDKDRFSSWEIYPNPNDGNFSVEVKVSSSRIPLNISIYDIYGAKFESRNISGSKDYLEAFNLARAGTGIYTVVLSAVGEKFYKNVLIVK